MGTQPQFSLSACQHQCPSLNIHGQTPSSSTRTAPNVLPSRAPSAGNTSDPRFTRLRSIFLQDPGLDLPTITFLSPFPSVPTECTNSEKVPLLPDRPHVSCASKPPSLPPPGLVPEPAISTRPSQLLMPPSATMAGLAGPISTLAHALPASCFCLPAAESRWRDPEHRRVSSRNTAAPSVPSSLSPRGAVWYSAPADSQLLPSPQQLFQTFPSPRAPDCIAPSLTDDLTSYMTEKMEASQLQLPARSSPTRKHGGHTALALWECLGRRHHHVPLQEAMRAAAPACKHHEPLLQQLLPPGSHIHGHSLPCCFTSLPTWGQATLAAPFLTTY